MTPILGWCFYVPWKHKVGLQLLYLSGDELKYSSNLVKVCTWVYTRKLTVYKNREVLQYYTFSVWLSKSKMFTFHCFISNWSAERMVFFNSLFMYKYRAVHKFRTLYTIQSTWWHPTLVLKLLIIFDYIVLKMCSVLN